MLLLSLSLIGCSTIKEVKEEVPLVRAEIIKMDTTGPVTNYSGEVRGRYETQLAFQVSGKIINRKVELGSVVNPGDVLMEIDRKDIEQTVNIGMAQVASTQSQLKLAAANLERYRILCEQGAISRAQLDQYQNSYDVSVAAAAQSSAQYTQGTNQLAYSSLIADHGGVISKISGEAGQVVSAGQTVLTLVQAGEREIEINVPENQIEQLRNAQQVTISFWALPGAVTQGKVREVSPIADAVSRTYKIRVSLLNPPPGMSLGMTANVAVTSVTNQQGIYIPLTALYQTSETPNVWVITDGMVNLRPIKVGEFGDGKVRIVEGLQGGEMIVTAGTQKLREGQKVRI